MVRSGEYRAVTEEERDAVVTIWVGRRLKRARGKRTQVEVAEQAGMSQSALSQIENGERTPSLRSLLRLCRALEVEPGEILRPAPVPLPRWLPPSDGVADEGGEEMVSNRPAAERGITE